MTRLKAFRLLRMAWVGLLLAATTLVLVAWSQAGPESTVDGATCHGERTAQGMRLVQASEENLVFTNSDAEASSASV